MPATPTGRRRTRSRIWPRGAAIDDPDERLRTALRELYAFYRRTERMMDNLHRDEPLMPIVKQRFGGFRDYLAAGRDVLMKGRRGKATRAAIGHALAFPTWRSLVREQGLGDAQAVELMCGLVARAAEHSGRLHVLAATSLGHRPSPPGRAAPPASCRSS